MKTKNACFQMMNPIISPTIPKGRTERYPIATRYEYHTWKHAHAWEKKNPFATGSRQDDTWQKYSRVVGVSVQVWFTTMTSF
mmetsp:Transcript_41385/g.99700  ORF Transcript_41385/g.99700 Transcript_41385/m.99700 type:complete len:82 (-) Transcript_41385:200-445(-)